MHMQEQSLLKGLFSHLYIYIYIYICIYMYMAFLNFEGFEILTFLPDEYNTLRSGGRYREIQGPYIYIYIYIIF
jgi:hypothetical protein